MNQLQNSLFRMKQAEAKIWTAESFYLGRNRTLTGDSGDNIADQEIVCESSNNLSPVEMSFLKLKQRENLNDYKQMISESFLKKTNIMELETKSAQDSQEEINRRRKFAESQVDTGKKDLKKSITPIPTSGGM